LSNLGWGNFEKGVSNQLDGNVGFARLMSQDEKCEGMNQGTG
jgi:hypothetical protein